MEESAAEKIANHVQFENSGREPMNMESLNHKGE